MAFFCFFDHVLIHFHPFLFKMTNLSDVKKQMIKNFSFESKKTLFYKKNIDFIFFFVFSATF